MSDANASIVLWTTAEPADWPGPPNDMTVSSLKEIEACPRRWALAAAAYPHVWNRAGYPPRLSLPSLTGTVIHLVLETIARALTRAGCTSVSDPACAQVMRDLGGYTKLTSDSVSSILARFTDNPRAAPLMEVTARKLRAQIPEMRARAQAILARVQLHPKKVGQVGGSKGRVRGPLADGSHSEVELRAPRIGWKGKVDLLTLSDAGVEIVDFKSGARDDSHAFQVRVYAFLWSADAEMNPSKTRIDKLTLSYRDGDVDVAPPTETELPPLERELVARRNSAFEAISERPPKARTTAENCRFCSVRQLCESYWDPSVVVDPDGDDGAAFGDVEITIVRRHGPSSWDGLVTASRRLISRGTVLLRASTPGMDLRSGDRVRILDARVVDEEEDGLSVVTMTAMTELFRVSTPDAP